MELSFVEIWVGRAESAERRLQEALEFFTRTANVWYQSVAEMYLCEAIYAQDRWREFLRRADAFGASTLMTDRHNLIRRQVVQAWSHLLRGSAVEAEVSAGRALKLLDTTDLVPDRVNALLALADALDARGMGKEAAGARRDAISALRAKANLAAVNRLAPDHSDRDEPTADQRRRREHFTNPNAAGQGVWVRAGKWGCIT